MNTKFIIRLKQEKGLSIIEATIVFPVMFFVIFFIIYIGNAYYCMAQVDDVVMRAAVRGSQYIADPEAYDMINVGTIPLEINDVEPYRFLLGEIGNSSINKIEDLVAKEVVDEVNEGLSFFKNMKPQITIEEAKIAEFNNNIIYYTFDVQLEYDIKFPIRFLGEVQPTIMRLGSTAQVSVNQQAEFIRNIDLVVDLVSDTKLGDMITSVFDKVNSAIAFFRKDKGGE